MTQSNRRNDDAGVARARRLWEAVRDGMTIYFYTGKSWDIIGPAALIVSGAEVTVTKADKSAERVIVGQIMAERTIDGVATRTATFTRVPLAAAASRPWYPVRDRQADAVGGMLGLSSGAKLGYCHYCGLELNRNGSCDECR